jgi:hypothetical protein
MRRLRALSPRSLYRWQLGLLLSGLPRRLIAGRFGDLTPRGPDDPLA